MHFRHSHLAWLAVLWAMQGCAHRSNRLSDDADVAATSVQCSPPPSDRAPSLTPVEVDALAGQYSIIVVGTQGVAGDSVVRGSLELWATDSAYAHGTLRPSGERRFPLAGASDVRLRRLAPVSLAYSPASRNRERPGVEMHRDGSMWFGNSFGGNTLTLDAGVVFNRVRLAPWGFQGEWQEGGLTIVNGASPAGYFCAIRVRR